MARSTSIAMFSVGVAKRIGELYMQTMGSRVKAVKRMRPLFSSPVYLPLTAKSALR